MEFPNIENIISFIFIYFIVWWIVLFCVLPFGIEPRDKNEEEKANDSGAPKNPQLKKKFIITSIIALVLDILIWIILGKIL